MLPVDHFFRAAQRFPERIAVKDGDMEITYADLARRTNALAAALQDIDPAPQTRVGICGYNTFEHLLAWLATFAAGKTWVPLNPRNGKPELDRICEVTGPGVVVVDADCQDKVDSGTATRITGKPGDGAEGIDVASLVDTFDGRMPVRHDVNLDDLQAIKFTGGSSGQPKGCMQTYRVWNTCIASMLHEFGFDGEDRNLLAAPMTHGTNTLIMPTFAVGGMQVFMGQAKPASIIEALERDRITSVFVPPTVIYMMMDEPGVEERDFSALRHLIVGGAAIRKDEVPRAMKVFNNALETCFGQTEAPQIAICMRAEDWADPENWASTGRATLLTRVEVMDTDGNILAPGETGEIVLKGDLVMRGYLDMPDKTAETIIDGWLHTGDVGIIDKRGFVYIKDRIRDVVITGGFNVYPSDVEAVLGQHPMVSECVVFGVPDRKWGEALTAAVEVRDGADVSGDEIAAFVKERLDSVKTPKVVHIVDELPRSPVGKVLRREAKVMFTPKDGEDAA
ncbi:MAG: AMP-binding protein [Rhodospirillales bacterium]|nr:AMP-binding protein [Rhodospirillales bacterium]MBO6785593.1 AMP-binding protein [Rhodospirillales bacterium]